MMTAEDLARKLFEAAHKLAPGYAMSWPAWEELALAERQLHVAAAALVLGELDEPPHARVQRAWETFCQKSTSTPNQYEEDGIRYQIGPGRAHPSGAITGAILRYNQAGEVTRGQAYRIEADGRVSRGPAVLRQIGQQARA